MNKVVAKSRSLKKMVIVNREINKWDFTLYEIITFTVVLKQCKLDFTHTGTCNYLLQGIYKVKWQLYQPVVLFLGGQI